MTTDDVTQSINRDVGCAHVVGPENIRC